MLFELLNCAFTAETMVAFKLDCAHLIVGNRLLCRYYLITVAYTAIGRLFCLTLRCNILDDFGSRFFNSLFKWGNQRVSCIIILIAYSIFWGDSFHFLTDLAKQHHIFWFGFSFACSDGFVFFVPSSFRFTNVALQKRVKNVWFYVLVKILNVSLSKLLCFWKAGNERVAHLSSSNGFIILILIIDPLHSAFNAYKMCTVESQRRHLRLYTKLAYALVNLEKMRTWIQVDFIRCLVSQLNKVSVSLKLFKRLLCQYFQLVLRLLLINVILALLVQLFRQLSLTEPRSGQSGRSSSQNVWKLRLCHLK